MDPSTLAQVFAQTFSADAEPRKQSEAYLKGISRQPGFAVALLQLVADGSADAMVRQAASVQWKNHLKFHWAAREDDAGLGGDAPFVIPDTEKEAVKAAGIVGIMLSAPPRVQAQVRSVSVRVCGDLLGPPPTLRVASPCDKPGSQTAVAAVSRGLALPRQTVEGDPSRGSALSRGAGP